MREKRRGGDKNRDGDVDTAEFQAQVGQLRAYLTTARDTARARFAAILDETGRP
jgi:hypothetical protein